MEPTKVFLITRPERADLLEAAIGDDSVLSLVGFSCTDGKRSITDLIKMCDPHVVLVDVAGFPGEPIEEARKVADSFPAIDCALLLEDQNFELLQSAYEAGIGLVLVEPVDWIEAGQKIAALRRRRAAQLSAQARSRRRVQRESDGRAVTLSFISAKDGEGKTTIALNVASLLAQKYRKKVVLFDLSSALSEVAMMLNRKAPGSYLDILKMMVSDFEFETVRAMTIDYLGDGKLLTLCGPTSLRVPEVKFFEIDLLIRLLQKNCEYLIIDAPVMFTEALKAALNISDWHVMITQNHIGSLRNTKLYLAELLKLDYPAHLVKVVLNRVSSSVGLSSKDMHRFVDPYPIVCGISSDGPTVLTALNEGTPFVLTDPGAEISQCVDNLAQQVLGTSPAGNKHFDLHAAISSFMDDEES